jgi:hypothetical protein
MNRNSTEKEIVTKKNSKGRNTLVELIRGGKKNKSAISQDRIPVTSTKHKRLTLKDENKEKLIKILTFGKNTQNLENKEEKKLEQNSSFEIGEDSYDPNNSKDKYV